MLLVKFSANRRAIRMRFQFPGIGRKVRGKGQPQTHRNPIVSRRMALQEFLSAEYVGFIRIMGLIEESYSTLKLRLMRED